MLRSKASLYAIALVAAAILAAPAAAQNPPGLGPLDHYRTWNVQALSINTQTVQLRDQFGFGEFLVTGPHFFSAPAQKNQEPVHNNRVHFTWYAIFNPFPDPNRNVLVHNQFGSTPITVGSHRYLVVPTLKNEPTIPGPFPLQPVDHYKCYDVVGQPTTPAPITATVTTQFGTETVQFAFIRFLCNPVEKNHLGRVHPITNPTDHLVCYEIPGPPLQRGIFRQDQFGFSDAVVQDSRWFCVPSLKEIPTGTEGTTWSRVRALYR